MHHNGAAIRMNGDEILMGDVRVAATGQVQCESPERPGFDRFLDLLHCHGRNVIRHQPRFKYVS